MAAAAQELRLKEQGSITQGATPKSGGTTYNLNWCCTTVWLVFSDNTGMYSWLSPGSVQLQDYCIRPVWVPGTVSAGLYCKGGRTCTFLCPRLIRARRNLVLNNRMANADTLKGAGIKSTRRRGTRKCQWRHVLNRTQFPRRWGTATLMDRSKSSIRPVPAMPKASHTVVPGEIGNRPSALKGT